MRVNRSLLDWGVFLIALGGVPLAVQQGWIDSGIAGDLWRVWPLILVGIGLGLVLRWTPLAWLGGAIVAGTLGLMFGALVGSGISGISSACLGPGDGGATTSKSGAAGGSPFSLDLELSCGTLSVVRGEGAAWSLEAVHSPDSPPTIDATNDGLRVRQTGGGDDFFTLTQQARNEWQVGLPADSAIAASLTLNAAEGDVDLGPGPFESLSGTFNAADVTIRLGRATTATTAVLGLTLNAASGTISLPAGSIAAKATLNASSLELCVPSDAELRVQHEGILSSDDLDQAGLTGVGGGWQTPGYDTSSARIDMRLSSTVSSISLERPEVCP